MNIYLTKGAMNIQSILNNCSCNEYGPTSINGLFVFGDNYARHTLKFSSTLVAHRLVLNGIVAWP